LTGSAEQTALAGGVDDAPPGQSTFGALQFLGFVAPVQRREMGGGEMALQVHAHHAVELPLLHGEAHGVADKTGVVHQDVQIAELANGGGHQGFGEGPIGHAALARHGTATGGDDRRDHVVGEVRQVVHHDAGALLGQQLGVATTHALTRTGHDRHFARQCTHLSRLRFRRF